MVHGYVPVSSRAPEIQASQLARAGITSVIGMLGFDATTKSMAALVAKTKALREDGMPIARGMFDVVLLRELG